MAVQQNKIVTTQAMKTAVALCTLAKTTYNDTTNAILLVTAGSDGALVKRLRAIPRATVTATQLQLYRSKDNGTTLYLADTKLMLAYTMAQTTVCNPTDFGYTADNPLRLEASERLYVAIGVALVGGVVFEAEYENF